MSFCMSVQKSCTSSRSNVFVDSPVVRSLIFFPFSSIDLREVLRNLKNTSKSNLSPVFVKKPNPEAAASAESRILLLFSCSALIETRSPLTFFKATSASLFAKESSQVGCARSLLWELFYIFNSSFFHKKEAISFLRREISSCRIFTNPSASLAADRYLGSISMNSLLKAVAFSIAVWYFRHSSSRHNCKIWHFRGNFC